MVKCIKCLNEISDDEKSCPYCGAKPSVLRSLFSFYNKLALKLQCCGKLLTTAALMSFALDIILFDKLEFNALMFLNLVMLWTVWLSGLYHLFSKPSNLELRNGDFTKISHFEKADPPIRKYFIVFITVFVLFLFIFTVDFISIVK